MIPNSITAIRDSTFCGCSGLISITIGNGVTNVGNSVFSGCASLNSITIPINVMAIGDSAFRDCSGLTSITIGSGVTSIRNFVFSGCTSLSSLAIPNGVTNLGYSSFSSCMSLNNITIPNSVYSIGAFAFSSCSNLTSIAIPASVTNIGNFAFSLCSGLTAITVDALNSAFSSDDGALFNKNRTTLIQCPGGKVGVFTIANSVTNIGSAFTSCIKLTSVTIGNSLTNIGSSAFSGCTNLSAITIDPLNSFYSSVDGVVLNKNQTTVILYPPGKYGNYAIPNTVTSIGNTAFFVCAGLTSVLIPDSVTNIGGFAFYTCADLKDVCFAGNAPSVNSAAFVGDNIATVYYLPVTTGWGPAFGGRPTAIWKPKMEASDATFGVQTNGFGFNINWAANQVVVVEACTNFSNPVWQPVQTNTLTGGSSYFSDPQWTNYPGRYYRLRSP
jgi:hypothetical protein